MMLFGVGANVYANPAFAANALQLAPTYALGLDVAALGDAYVQVDPKQGVEFKRILAEHRRGLWLGLLKFGDLSQARKAQGRLALLVRKTLPDRWLQVLAVFQGGNGNSYNGFLKTPSVGKKSIGALGIVSTNHTPKSEAVSAIAQEADKFVSRISKDFPPFGSDVTKEASRLYQWCEKNIENLALRFVIQASLSMALPDTLSREHSKRIRRSLEVFPAEERFVVMSPSGLWPTDASYLHFSAIYYLTNLLVGPDLFYQLQLGKTLLSVGAGPGHLERFLNRALGIPVCQIHVTDKDPYPSLEEAGFEFYQFDMTKPWPTSLNQYDYIIFPMSFGLAHEVGRVEDRLRPELEGYASLVASVLKGQFDTSDDQIAYFVEDIEKRFPQLGPQKFKTIEVAYRHLRQEGEIRIQGHVMANVAKVYLTLKMRERYPDCKLHWIGHPETEALLIIKKRA